MCYSSSERRAAITRKWGTRRYCAGHAMGNAVERGDESLFRGNAGSLKLYRLVRGYITNLGAVDIVPRKTQVGFRHGRYFAWVWLPQMWIRHQPRDSITLSFGLDRRVRDHRIRESVEPYPGRFTHHVVMLQASDFDPKVKALVREAFELAGRRSRRPPNPLLPAKPLKRSP